MSARYAVVTAPGCCAQHETLRALYTSDDLARARARAAAWTREYRRAMARYGGSGGGYVVVAVDVEDRKGDELGMAMDVHARRVQS